MINNQIVQRNSERKHTFAIKIFSVQDIHGYIPYICAMCIDTFIYILHTFHLEENIKIRGDHIEIDF